MAARSCTCWSPHEGEHYRHCASLLPDPDTCPHTRRVRRDGFLFCSDCGKGCSPDGPAWVRPELEPGWAERVLAERKRQKDEQEARLAREESYGTGEIWIDGGGVTDLSDEALATLAEACARELRFRAGKLAQQAP